MEEKMIKITRFVLIVYLLSLGFVLAAEQMPNPETESTVPELIDFHDIIYPIWHTAFPAKDYAALRGFVPAIEAGMAKINAAVLPGILREKKQAWESGLAEFNKAVAAYKKAAAGTTTKRCWTPPSCCTCASKCRSAPSARWPGKSTPITRSSM